jgi:hypothetical protein
MAKQWLPQANRCFLKVALGEPVFSKRPGDALRRQRQNYYSRGSMLPTSNIGRRYTICTVVDQTI